MIEEIRLHQFAEKLELAGYSWRTIGSYCDALRLFFKYLEEKERIDCIEDLRPEHLEGYQTHVQFAPRKGGDYLNRGTVANRLHPLKTFFRIMSEAGLLSGDPGSRLVLPKRRRNPPRFVPSQAQAKAILEAAAPIGPLGVRDRAILELLYATGIRSEELLTLCVDDWNQSDNTLFIQGKGGKDRVVPVGSWVLPYLREYLAVARPALLRQTSALLFVSKTGAALARSNLRDIVAGYARKAGVERVSPHTLRHACATHLLENGADIRWVQELLGHADLSTTQIYTKVDISFLRRAHRRYHPRERSENDG